MSVAVEPVAVEPSAPAINSATQPRGGDPFQWLRDDTRTDPKVLAYLASENEYAAQQLRRLRSATDALCAEMDARLPPVEEDAPRWEGGFMYFRRRRAGDEHWTLLRRPAALGALEGAEGGTLRENGPSEEEEVVLDENALARGQDYWDVMEREVSPDGRLLAYAVDTTGDEACALTVRDIESGEALLARPVTGVSPAGLVWGGDSRSLYYVAEGGSSPSASPGADPAAPPQGPSVRLLTLPAAAPSTRGGDAASRPPPAPVRSEAVFDPGGAGLSLRRTRDGAYLVAQVSVSGSSEVHVLPLAAAEATPSQPASSRLPPPAAAAWQLLLDREDDVDCLALDHWRGGVFFALLDDDDAPDGKVVALDLAHPRYPWQVLVPSEPNTEVEALAVAARHMAVAVKTGGRSAIRIYDLPASAGGGGGPLAAASATSAATAATAATAASAASAASAAPLLLLPPAVGWTLSFEDPTLVVTMAPSGPFEGAALRVAYSSRVTPQTEEAVDMRTRQRVVVHVEQVLGGFSAGDYAGRIEWATSADGVAVPVSVAWRRDRLAAVDATNPCLLQAYGAYGSKQWPTFNPCHLSLLDRGWVLAVAHVRGGGELGSRWHTDGKKLRKRNTFDDLLAAASHLHAAGYSAPARTAVWGRSAGGLTVGAALNMAPGLFGAAILDVPFLDPLATMQDPGLLLTVKERREWGDPTTDEEVFRYMLSYSPYDNLRLGGGQSSSSSGDSGGLPPGGVHSGGSGAAGAAAVSGQESAAAPVYPYPAMLVTASLHDHRVNFWEPAKYVAALRRLRARVVAAAAAAAGPASPARPVSPQRTLGGAAAEAAPGGGGSSASGSESAGGGVVEQVSRAGAGQLPLLLFETDMAAGHFAASGASSRLRALASKFAFLLHVIGGGRGNV